MPRSRSERADRKPAASHATLMTSSSEARTRPGLSTRWVRLVSQRCARNRTKPVTTASTSAAIIVGSPVAWPLAASSAAFSWVEDGVRGGQQHQVRLLRGDLEERAAGEREAHRVLGLRLGDIAGVDGQPGAERGERGARGLAAAARRSRDRSWRRVADVALVALQRVRAGWGRRGRRR